MINKKVALAISSLLAAGSLQAQTSAPLADNGFSYNYAQVGYQAQDWDGGFEVDVLEGRVAHALDKQLFLRGAFNFFDGDIKVGRFGDIDVDGWTIAGGLGFHTPLQNNMDLVLTGDIVRISYDVDNVGDDDDIGFALSGGARLRSGDKLELYGGVFAQDVDESEAGLFGELLVHASPGLDVGAELKLGDDLTQIGVFARFNY